MTALHPNIELLKRFDPSDMAASADLFAEDVVFHYYNPNLPDLQGDHIGRDGVRAFFETLGERSRGTFQIEPVSVAPVGHELVVVQSRNTLTLENQAVTVDVVVVWRFVDGRVAEVWDIVPGQPTEVHDVAS